MSRLDQIYRSLLLTKFFTKGWGNPDNLKRLFDFRKVLSCREACQDLVPPNYPVYIDQDRSSNGIRIIDGHFTSPFTIHLPNIMPVESEIARFQMVLPKDWNTRLKPVCIHLAGTGDHYFWRRRTLLARPLLKEAGIASIILENPYYGVRKPKQQLRSSLHNVSDLFVMGGGLVLESLVLLRWCEEQGYGPLGMTGISMGGHMASLAAASWLKPLSLIPCLSWTSASVVFTQGVLSGAIPWDLLQEQYFADNSFEKEVAKRIESPEWDRSKGAFNFGQQFARTYPSSVADMETLQRSFVSESSDRSGEFTTAAPEMPNKELDVEKARVCMSAGGGSKIEIENERARVSMSAGSGWSSTVGGSGVVSSGLSTSTASVRHHTTSSEKENKEKVSSAVKRLMSIGGVELLRRSSSALQIIGGSRANEESLIELANKQRGQKEAWWFMRGVMDECTHLGNFAKPIDTDLIIIIAARSDAYVPRSSIRSLEELWPGSEVRYINTGHITAFLFKQAVFRKAIIDSFDRQIAKYYS